MNYDLFSKNCWTNVSTFPGMSFFSIAIITSIYKHSDTNKLLVTSLICFKRLIILNILENRVTYPHISDFGKISPSIILSFSFSKIFLIQKFQGFQTESHQWAKANLIFMLCNISFISKICWTKIEISIYKFYISMALIFHFVKQYFYS